MGKNGIMNCFCSGLARLEGPCLSYDYPRGNPVQMYRVTCTQPSTMARITLPCWSGPWRPSKELAIAVWNEHVSLMAKLADNRRLSKDSYAHAYKAVEVFKQLRSALNNCVSGFSAYARAANVRPEEIQEIEASWRLLEETADTFMDLKDQQGV